MPILTDKTSCGGFPGPGDAEHSVTMNPMQEYVQGRDNHHSEMFGKFRRQHKKEYVNDKEMHGRMHTFRQNVRLVLENTHCKFHLINFYVGSFICVVSEFILQIYVLQSNVKKLTSARRTSQAKCMNAFLFPSGSSTPRTGPALATPCPSTTWPTAPRRS